MLLDNELRRNDTTGLKFYQLVYLLKLKIKSVSFICNHELIHDIRNSSTERFQRLNANKLCRRSKSASWSVTPTAPPPICPQLAQQCAGTTYPIRRPLPLRLAQQYWAVRHVECLPEASCPGLIGLWVTAPKTLSAATTIVTEWPAMFNIDEL